MPTPTGLGILLLDSPEPSLVPGERGLLKLSPRLMPMPTMEPMAMALPTLPSTTPTPTGLDILLLDSPEPSLVPGERGLLKLSPRLMPMPTMEPMVMALPTLASTTPTPTGLVYLLQVSPALFLA